MQKITGKKISTWAPWKLILMKAKSREKYNSCEIDFLSTNSEKDFFLIIQSKDCCHF